MPVSYAVADDWTPAQHTPYEEWWVHRRDLLEKAGYRLRPRYQPGWKPSWDTTEEYSGFFEDGQYQPRVRLFDAQRVSDGSFVYMKRMAPTSSPTPGSKLSKGLPDELRTHQYLLSEPLKSDPRNHTVPILDVIPVPDSEEEGEGEVIVVTPMLRQFYDPRFESYGETVAFFTQVFEAVAFMHEHRVVHGDCTKGNIMLDPSRLYPDSFHPIERNRRPDWNHNARHSTRTHTAPKYFLIDFGLSHRFTPEEEPALCLPAPGGDKSAPEHRRSLRETNTPCDPFPTDVYYLGNMVRRVFVDEAHGFEFMAPLVEDMVHPDPAKRPTMDEVVRRYGLIRDALSTRKLRARVVWRDEWFVTRIFRDVLHVFRTAGYVLMGKPAIPMP